MRDSNAGARIPLGAARLGGRIDEPIMKPLYRFALALASASSLAGRAPSQEVAANPWQLHAHWSYEPLDLTREPAWRASSASDVWLDSWLEPRHSTSFEPSSTPDPWSEAVDLRALALPEPLAPTRSAFDGAGAASLAVDDIPGGIVFGRTARSLSSEAWSGIHLDAAGRVHLVSAGGADFVLPPTPLSIVVPCSEFALQHAADDTLIDMVGYDIRLAPELVDTHAGAIALRADVAPHAHMPGLECYRSVILDGDIRLRADAPQGAVAFEVDLEVHMYGHAGPRGHALRALAVKLVDGRLQVSVNPGLEAALREVADLAGWIGFFRWARQQDLPGLADVATRLRELRPAPVPTPRTCNRSAGPPPAQSGFASAREALPDWMRVHREKVLTEARAAWAPPRASGGK